MAPCSEETRRSSCPPESSWLIAPDAFDDAASRSMERDPPTADESSPGRTPRLQSSPLHDGETPAPHDSWHAGPDVAFVELGDAPSAPAGALCAVRLPGGRPLVLNDSAALVWQLATAVPERELVASVAEATGEDPTEIRDGVEHVVAQLVHEGLLCQ